MTLRVVGYESLPSGAVKYLLQYDDGTLQANRPTYSVTAMPGSIPLRIGAATSTTATKASLLETLEALMGMADANVVFTFKGGGTASPGDRIYTDWAALYAAMQNISAPKLVLFDAVPGAITIPVGTWDLRLNVSLAAKPGQVMPVTVTRAVGATLPNPYFVSPSITIV